MNLEGKNIIITGGSSGIGEATAISCAMNGARVGIISRTKQRLERVVNNIKDKGGEAEYHVADLVKRYGSDGSLVPEALTEYIKAREGYDYSEHGRAGNTHTDFVPDEIIDRFCILGDASSHIEKLSELKGLGVDQFAFYLMHDQQDETLEAYGQSIIPVLNK